MLAKIEELDGALQCPRTARPIRFVDGRVKLSATDGDCEACDYPVAKNKPVLIDFDNSVIQRDDVVDTSAASVVEPFLRREVYQIAAVAREEVDEAQHRHLHRQAEDRGR